MLDVVANLNVVEHVRGALRQTLYKRHEGVMQVSQWSQPATST